MRSHFLAVVLVAGFAAIASAQNASLSIDASLNGGNPPPNNRVFWNGSIPAGGNVTITIQARVNTGAAGSPISNQAAVAFDADGNGTNEASGASNAAVFTPLPVSAIPAMSHLALIALGLLLAGLALRRSSWT